MSVRSRTVIRKTRRGGLQRLALEHYLRDDLPCTHELCPTCSSLLKARSGISRGKLRNTSATPIFIPDAQAVLQQLDVLEHLDNVMLYHSVLKAVRSADASVYDRVKDRIAGSSASGDTVMENGNLGVNWTVFSNENHSGCYVEKGLGEDEVSYQSSLMKSTLKWLSNHWKKMIDKGSITEVIVLLGNSKSESSQAFSGIPGISIFSIEGFVTERRKDLVEAFAEVPEEEGEEMEIENNASAPAKRRQVFPNFISDSKARQGVKSRRLYQGVYHPSPYNYRESYVSVRMDPADQSKLTKVLLSGREAQNRAIDGDNVVIELLPRSEWLAPSRRVAEEEDDNANDDDVTEDTSTEKESVKVQETSSTSIEEEKEPTGRVVAIGKRNWRPYCGAVVSKSFVGGDRALFAPIDRRIPRIRIRSRRISDLLGKRLLVVIDKWDRRSAHPDGHVVREIGVSGDKEAETQVLLIENGIPTRKFSDKAMACLPDENWRVTPEHVESRWDLRETVICSVDPPGCTDIDDALHFKRISEQEVEVGVHIADVTAFVRHDSALDQEASERGTTVYLVDRRIEMLPSLLSSNLCSLKGNVERLAFSCVLRMDNDGNVLSSQFGRSVIKSRAALTYAAAQEKVDAARKQRERGLPIDDPVSESLVGLANIAAKLRKRRMDAGALILASPEPKFKISEETDAITDVHVYETRETNRMVEEFMLLANIVVANRTLKQFPHCAMLRRHPKPSQEMFEPLLKAAKAANVNLDVTNSKTLNESLARIAKDGERKGDAYLGTLLRILATRCMTQAVYFSSGEVSNPEFLHYGLAAPVYTHFTSPIRRYADVLVHRLLSSCLGYSSLPMKLQDSKQMQRLADVVNERHRCAQYAARASADLHTVLLFKNKTLKEPGRILRVLANGLVVLIPRYGVEGIVPIDEEQKPVLNDIQQTLILKNGKVFRILQSVQVQIRVDSAPETRDKVLYELV